MKDKKIVITFITTIGITIAVFFSALFIYDPLMLFHKPFNRDVTLNKNMRIQAYGIIRNLDYDSFILGTSMLENTSANIASSVVGGRFANISLTASDYHERSYILETALKNGAKNIIYSLDYVYLDQRKGIGGAFPLDSFTYIYSNSLERIKIYVQTKYIKCLLMWSESAQCLGDNKTVDRPNSWIEEKVYYSRFGGLDNWFSAKNNPQIKAAFKSISLAAKRVKNGEYEFDEEILSVKVDKSVQYVEDNIISYIRAYPNTQFHLIFPPYSRILFSQWHQLKGTEAKIHEAVVCYFAKVATELENLSVYGYEDQDFLDDISNYKDPHHYDEWVDELMLHDISESRHLLTAANCQNYLQTSRDKALSFDLIGLGDKIDTYLGK